MSNPEKPYLKGRGAQINPSNPFDQITSTDNGLQWEDTEAIQSIKNTEYLTTYPKTIINKVSSPDIGMAYSMNPYQGCEHGCTYCYARNTHTFWGYSSGVDFEQKILVKKNAAELLESKLRQKNWHARPIMLAGNTDCYQPAESTYRITRKILEVAWKYRHPVGLITKNKMILRDIDLLESMAKEHLVQVSISLTTLNESLRRALEPRTSTASNRLETIAGLASAKVPVQVMMAPIIPSLNDHEIYDIAEKAADNGARGIGYTVIRLNGDVAEIFTDWLKKNYPDRAARILKQIASCHGGSLNDSRFGKRMKGEGNWAEIIRQQFHQVREKYFSQTEPFEYNTTLYPKFRDRQMTLF